MNSLKIAQGDETVKVELTLKEAMALAGAKFPNNHNVEVSARRKLNSVIGEHCEGEERVH